MHFFLKHWQRRRLVARIARARRAGVGLRTSHWDGPASTVRPSVVEWCREAMSCTRRPYGVSFFDLTIAVHDHSIGRPTAAKFRRILPEELWSESRLTRALAELLPDGSHDLAAAVTLFSWGEATHAALSN